MIDLTHIDHSVLDRPEILMFLFHPRRDGTTAGDTDGNYRDFLIPVGEGVELGARLHPCDKSEPLILYFHGNGEIVSDYDDMGPLYARIGINFLVVDYRGYGRSSGSPTVTSMMRDCHHVFLFVKDWMEKERYTGPLIVMGRSLGSAPALEIASHYGEKMAALIIESGFAYAVPLLRLLGIDVAGLGIREEEGMGNINKIKEVTLPTLIIHAEYDHIIPFADGQALYNASASGRKSLLKIPNANHNNIFYFGMQAYMEAIHKLSRGLGRE